jgi:hypothetical protein
LASETQRAQIAARQQRFRRRQADARRAEQQAKGLPALPAIPTMPGKARWSAMIQQAHTLLSEATAEMQNYHNDRSEQWQDSAKAEEMLARLERLEETIAQLQEAE